METTPVDIKFVIDELRSLEGYKIDNIFHKDRKIRISIHNHDLIVAPDIMYSTKRAKLKDITEFALMLRKYLKNKIVDSIEQYNFSKVVEMKTGDNILILEFSDKGNCILCDNSYRIIMPLEFMRIGNRKIAAKEQYTHPRVYDIVDVVELKRLLNSEKSVKDILSDSLGRYAVEALADLDGDKTANKLSSEEVEVLHTKIRALMTKEFKPQVVLKNKLLVDVLPFDLDENKNDEKRYFSSFNEALDYFFSRMDYLESIKRLEKKRRKMIRKKRRKRLKKRRK